jgi:uncharacterized protein (DUF1697 family)
MAKYAAFLRGINVTGRRIKGPELCAPFETMGFEDVATFRASGNVIFSVGGRAPAPKLTARIEEGLEASLGYDVAVFLRSASEVRAIADHDPFPPAEVQASKGKLQVAMLAKRPSAPARKAALALATERDRLAFGRRELYWLPSGGTQESELDQKALGKLLGVTTMRTKGTVEQIAAKYFGSRQRPRVSCGGARRCGPWTPPS